MAITYMSWNVQNFGQATQAYANAKGNNSLLLAQFIARTAARNDVSILSIMEVMPTALPHLRSLLAALNAHASAGANDWMFDYIKGSVDTLTPPGAVVNSPADLSWQSGTFSPRREGYGIFWRNGHADFTMLRAVDDMSEGSWHGGGYAPPAPVPTNVLVLSRMGRDLIAAQRPPRAAANFNPAGAAGAPFGISYYPDVSTLIGPGSIWYEDTRRPAVAIIRRTAGVGDAAKVVPLLTYHAPSNPALAALGTYISGLAKPLYVAGAVAADNKPSGASFHPSRTVASGDFNLPAGGGNNWANAYSAYVNAFGAADGGGNPNGGANATPIYDDNAPITTTIQIYAMGGGGLFNGPAINAANNNAYSFSAIDNMFERNTAHTHFAIVDLMADVRGANVDTMAGIQAYAADMNFLDAANMGAHANTGPVDAAGNSIFTFFDAGIANDWATFLAGVNAGTFPNARSAAVFLRQFVSDHLPMMIEFT